MWLRVHKLAQDSSASRPGCVSAPWQDHAAANHLLDRWAQIAFLSAATGNAFTTVLAGLALTTASLPNIMRLPAFVAGFTRVFTVHTPGTTNFPAFFTCAWATSAKTPRIFEHSDFLRPDSVASASAMAP